MAEQSSNPPPVLGTPNETCCGENYPGNAGKPLGLRCGLCPTASIYFRNEPRFKARQQRVAVEGHLPHTPGR